LPQKFDYAQRFETSKYFDWLR